MNFLVTHPQFSKELRPLVLPWIGAVAAGSLLSLTPLVDSDGLGSILRGVAIYGFFGGLALIAALALGAEFQEKTFPLLLTQPITRWRLWRGKMLVTTGAVATAVAATATLLLGISGWYYGNQVEEAVKAALSGKDMVLAGMFLLVTVCSCGYWTLIARSIIGGLAFTVAAQFVSGVVLASVCGRLTEGLEKFNELQPNYQRPDVTFAALMVGGLLYSGLFLWLGWKRFARLELRGAGAGEPASGLRARALPWPTFLVCRPTNPSLNLLRKEARLQKPVAQMAAVFILCWVCTVLLQRLWPKQDIIYVLDVLACLFVPMASLLGGCISLGEEKALGVTTAQLTLPFSRSGQWFLKLLASAATAATLGFGLLLLLSWTTEKLIDVRSSGLMNPRDNGLLVLANISAVCFLLGYWAISLTPNTVRAALVAVAALVVFGCCVVLGAWCGNQSERLYCELFTAIMCHFQLPPDYFAIQLDRTAKSILIAVQVLIVLILLGQSLKQFRRAAAPGNKLFKYGLILAIVIFTISACWDGIGRSVYDLRNARPVTDLAIAVRALAENEPGPSLNSDHNISPQELEGRISEQTKTWLRNAEISYRRSVQVVTGIRRGSNEIRTSYQIDVRFPKGRAYSFATDLQRSR
jgi:ABC-type transport system involved in multi-copper enzyme maturation permease subunit